ncbi:MAG: AAA family ATPase [Candidatus Eisenbacteria bacterium]|uniref:AAA family ATPase n=1 Tax=Eiseniibacteriota bacterium TaxID=2212470 RepID=A0A948RUP6_UNCEI|nr:AAA family ATPase [Candidatus Eisenbacteria bacterium]MBU1950114.1 AAA family ATPase [Candidatus Eisenbacteria bacterium]MBU2691340.1 AAA family ATPase [Candidatus Eisenbacteria bacterium]
MDSKKRVFVTGDFVLDHHIYEGVRHHYADSGDGVRHIRELGGAALIEKILRFLLDAKDGDDSLVLGTDFKIGDALDSKKITPDNDQAYAIWGPTLKNPDKEPKVWRVSFEMGFGGNRSQLKRVEWPSSKEPQGRFDVVVISDGGLGFRDSSKEWLADALKEDGWIVLKTAAPLQEGALWSQLLKDHSDRLVVILSASELRKSNAQISSGLSWEESLETLGREIVKDGALDQLPKCRHLIVAFESEGALWIDLNERPKLEKGMLEKVVCHFIYQASGIEGDHQRRSKGRAFGFLSCLTAAIVKPLVRGGAVDFSAALEGGLSAMHDLLENGHGPSDYEASGFPAERLAGVINEATCRYSRAVLPLSSLCEKPTCPDSVTGVSSESGGCWSLLREVLKSKDCECIDPAYDLAKLVIRHGPIALESLPHLRMKALMSVDRREIEALRGLERIVQEYADRKKAKKPLSIGVFGPPGSGKSFTVKQFAQSLLGKDGWMEFNLSQFSGPEDLNGAFHQIRDAVLRGLVPVAFFDEFDAQEYRWLQYLLAPMQDGYFQDGQITHPIGKCIFIFAGGTSRSFETFGPVKPGNSHNPGKTSFQIEREEIEYRVFKFAKGPDFKSRLDGFLNINGPNRRCLPAEEVDSPDICDIFFPIRRAFITRGEFNCEAHTRLNIDEGLLNAIVEVESYKHGSRSLGKVLDPLKAALPGALYRSLIPPRGQLALHTDADAFLEKCRLAEPTAPIATFKDDADRLRAAKAIHDTWQTLGVVQGWKTKDSVVPFEELAKFWKNSNLAAADRMAEILSLVDLKLEEGGITDDQRKFVLNKIEYHLELMAEVEHAGWMDWHLEQGWILGPKKDKDLRVAPTAKSHPCLRPYTKLSDLERNKDRNSIRHFLDFAEAGGMRIVPVRR